MYEITYSYESKRLEWLCTNEGFAAKSYQLQLRHTWYFGSGGRQQNIELQLQILSTCDMAGDDGKEDDDGDPAKNKGLILKKELWFKKGKKHRGSRMWPPPVRDMEEDDEVYDPEGDLEGCPFCEDKPCNPALAWSAFYDEVYSLRSSWCIGRGCEDPAWDNQEEEDPAWDKCAC
jgi:hypothetical protein